MVKVRLTNGTEVALSVPNKVTQGDGFYVSFNRVDVSIYGSITTALVDAKSNFYILNGDHRLSYAPLIAEGYEACLDYFNKHISQINFRSDKPPVDPNLTENSQE